MADQPGTQSRARLLACAGFALALSLGAPRSSANMADAHAAFEAGDHARAVMLYRRYARLGSPVARYNFAMLLLAGRVLPRDEPEGFAWLDLAAEQGDAQSIARRDRVLAGLSPADADVARARAAALRADYGPAALDARLNPVPRLDVPPPARFLLRRGRIELLVRTAFVGQCEGEFRFEFSVDGQGRVHDVVGEGYANGIGERDACIREAFPLAAARVGQLRFDVDDGLIAEGAAFLFHVVVTRQGGRIVGRIVLPRGDLARAREGHAGDQLAVALQLMFGVRAQRDEGKARRWLTLAKAEGATRVHYLDGIRALQRGDMQAAAAAFREGDSSGDIPARRRLAWLAATSADASLMDAALALRASGQIPLHAMDVEGHDIRAAALARAGRHAEATALLDGVLARLQQFGGDYDDVRKRRANYSRGEPFSETSNPWRRASPP